MIEPTDTRPASQKIAHVTIASCGVIALIIGFPILVVFLIAFYHILVVPVLSEVEATQSSANRSSASRTR